MPPKTAADVRQGSTGAGSEGHSQPGKLP